MTTYTEEMVHEIKLCHDDVDHFITNYLGMVPCVDTMDALTHPYKRFPLLRGGDMDTVLAVLFHAAMFEEYRNIGVLVSTQGQAFDVGDRIREFWSLTPEWLRVLRRGIYKNQKQRVEFENGSMVVAFKGIPVGVNGRAWSHVYVHDFCRLDVLTQKEFFDSIYPVMSSGKRTKMIVEHGRSVFDDKWYGAYVGAKYMFLDDSL